MRLGLLLGFIILNFTGCLGITISKPGGTAEVKTLTKQIDVRENVSGIWEYREGEVVCELFLDHRGNGTYDWQQGRFETTALSQGRWKGKWVQTGNDREGECEAQLAADGMSAHGRWWYLRIGDDFEPLDPDGQFRLIRKSDRN